MKLRLLVFALTPLIVSGAPRPAHSQRADSATNARVLYGRAVALFNAGDTAAAADSAIAAARAWPRQGAYHLAAARLAAWTGRPDDAVQQLRIYTNMGYSWSPGDVSFKLLAGEPGFQALAGDAARNAAPILGSSEYRVIAERDLHPEGVAVDQATGRVFVSSIRKRKVVVIERDGRVLDFVPALAGLDATFGLAVDARRNTLWIASGVTPEQEGAPRGTAGGSELVAVNLGTGAISSRWTVPDTAGPHLLGDVSISPDGRVYTTDSRAATVYRLPADAEGKSGGTLDRAPFHHKDWVSPQGLAFSEDGKTAWLADWTTGLFRIDVTSNVVSPVAADPSIFTLGVDGLYRVGNGLLVGLQNGITPPRVVAFRLDESGGAVVSATVLDRHLPIASEPTLGTVVAGSLIYVANSPWAHYDANGNPDPAKPFPAPTLLVLPLKR